VKALFLGAATLAILTSTASFADTPTAKEFVAKAGASDTFEIDSARLMATSKNHAISMFATQMITDHSKSTKMVEAAARADHIALKRPEMTVGQRTDITALKALPNGKTRDDLYVKQQKAAHDDALALMQDYSANGAARHLKMAAGKIGPVVEKHQSMLSTM
jgi:putative membrane protein